MLCSAFGDDHVISSEDQPLSIAEWSKAQHSVPVQLYHQCQGNVGDPNAIIDASQVIPMDPQSNDEILRSDSAIALDHYP
jgi:hypothetical protein